MKSQYESILLGIIFGMCLCPHPLFAQQQTETSKINRDGGHDFDFETGNRKISLKRLQHPLTGFITWVEYTGPSKVRFGVGLPTL
jgi:hypothetical protein